ncbi:MAG: hypothetical protein M3Q36_02890 [bacterium]|nr:hypothetical protein [bacterium]
MTVKKSNSFDKSKGILVIIIGLLLFSLMSVVVSYSKKASDAQGNIDFQKGSIVSLGSLEYDFSSGKAVKKTDANLASLRSFLIAEGEKSVGSNCETVYHNVIVASPDEKEVLLDFGCTHPGSRMFAVQREGKWQLLSPTNQFDLFGIPRCEYVDSNNIDRSIAPVCTSQSLDGTSSNEYSVR